MITAELTSNSLWVGSSGQYNLDYTIELASRLNAKGFEILLDFHFSDSWADPSQNYAPDSWPTDVSSLSSTLRGYVSSTLESFSAAGVNLTLVALGNEVTTGFLWPTGKISNNNFANFATLLAAARDGVSDAVGLGVHKPQVMIHLDNGWDQGLQTWWYKALLATGTVTTDDFDVIGVSFYPFYGTSATLDNLQASLNTLASTYGKPVMVAETDWPVSCSGVALSESIDVSASGQSTWVKNIASVLESVPSGLGQGLFYWEPAFINNTSLNSDCKDVILFDVDWSTWPNTKATARASVDMFQ